MSVHKLPAATNELEKAQSRRRLPNLSDDDDGPRDSNSSSSTGEDDDENWDDWVSSEGEEHEPCISLFDGSSHPNVDASLAYDNGTFGVDILAIASRLRLDFHGRVRLVNYIRKVKPSTVDVNALTGQEAFFSTDEYLIPVIQDDPLLQFGSDNWSDDEGESCAASEGGDKDKMIRALSRQLEQAKKDLMDFRALVKQQFRDSEVAKALAGENEQATASSSKAEGTPKRDDDTHYFDSYGENEIHYVMLRDKVRTSTYASFILNSPDVFRDAIVLDVGCGTGILSLFAVRAGAKRVFAVDASKNIAEKAREIVRINGLDDVITVINSKVEDISLPDGITQVDVIVSEWMGYALLYESMLDSVLVARDRFLKPRGGLIAPSQARMLLALSSANEVVKDRVEYWSDVHGFDMSPMAEGVYEDAIIEVVGSETLLSDTTIIKNINLATVSPHHLSFSAPFELHGTSVRKTVAHAFILYFDIFFTEDGAQVGAGVRAHGARDGEPVLAEVWRPGSPSRARSPSLPRSPTRTQRLRRASSMKVKKEEPWKSFTTGPENVPTHWKQTLFLLKEPIVVREDTTVSGTFHCRKSADNSRELDVEIHYVVRATDSETDSTEESAMYIQSFKVR
ncbi:S-adenosyl-L-methionine-dependent methyltransferase [Fomitiporia mediterranea MF3/22]|uniref:S-adenosyl-L-methionine-dependent methyltransferase n=1 Tax=Fomitiporia mediterranea (strain MF3/22) TaxID=694068 RepID=UPI0004407355|nr:S-adenosyl-L-methionine-dependent methyltransferase [Fomitiporia mediterranea MF3/22]EJC98461.1 S-adenosyl-L-methionine-dependent methyltransferase [Fomitiporia mediterranea MF3/22]